MSSKSQEAKAHAAAAHKALKKSFMKWSVDYSLASHEYEKAAICFRAAHEADLAMDAFILAAECYLKTNSYFLAAKNFDQAAQLAKESNQHQKAFDLYTKHLPGLYRQADSPDKAAESYIKGAGELFAMDPSPDATGFSHIVECYEKAFQVYEEEGRAKMGLDHYKKAVSLCVQYKAFDKATEILGRLSGIAMASEGLSHRAYKAELCIAVLLCYQGDQVEAGKRLARLKAR